MSAIDFSSREPGYFELARSIFRGRLGWVSWTVMATQIVLFLAGVYAAVQFFAATDVLLAVKWGMTALFLLLTALVVKMSLWQTMQANRILSALNETRRGR